MINFNDIYKLGMWKLTKHGMADESHLLVEAYESVCENHPDASDKEFKRLYVNRIGGCIQTYRRISSNNDIDAEPIIMQADVDGEYYNEPFFEDENAIYIKLLHKEIKTMLTEEENKIVEMLIAGYTQKEIGDELGITQAWVGMKLHKIRAKLKEIR